MSYSTILEIIESFYDIVKKDVMIGYHFRFIEDFETHIPRIADFWNLQLNGELKDKSNLPFDILATHTGIGIKRAEIGRWLMLFEMNLQTFLNHKKVTQKDVDLWNEKIEIFKNRIEKSI